MKDYQKPIIKIVLIDDNDIFCTSTEGVSESVDKDAGARQRNPIWDDYE